MSELGNFTQALMGAANNTSNVINNYVTNQAKLSTQSKQIKLQADINNELMKIQQSSDYSNWQKNMNNFFSRVKSGMSDKNSQYFCENNLQAEMFESILSENQVGVTQKVNQMVYGAQKDHAIVDYNNNLELYAQQYTGQDYITKANEGAKLLYDCGYINEEQLQKQYDTNFQRAYIDVNLKLYSDSVADAVKNNMSEDQFIADIKSKTTELMAIDTAGLPKNFDKEAMDEALEKQGRSNYRAYVQDVQNRNETQLSEVYTKMLTYNTAEGRNAIRMQGQAMLAQMTGLQIDNSSRNKYAQYFALENYLDGGTTTKSQAKAAINKLEPKDAMNFFLNAIKRGDESDLGGPATVYNSYELFKGKCMDELLKINPEYTYTELEQSCPTVMEYLEYAKQKLPPLMQDVVEDAKNMLESCLGDKEAATQINGVMDLVYDMLFEANISDFDAAQQKVYADRIARAINSKYGSKLEKDKKYNWLKKETNISAITNYQQGVFGQEKALAQAMQARENNPDIYYKNMYGNEMFWMGEDVQKGLTLIENAERQMVADVIKYKTGKDIDPASIPAAYESDSINDVNARNIYTVNGHDYYFTSKDGQHVTMYEKKTGEKEWHEAKTKEQQEKYDSPRETAKRAIQDIDVSTVPPFKVPASGVMPETQYSQKQWNSMNNIQKKNVIMSLLSKYPDEMQQWLDEQPDKKKK